MADLLVQSIEPSYEGLNTNAAPDLLPKGQGPEVANFLVHQDGKLSMRGPILDHTELALGASIKTVAGAWTFDDKVLFSFVDTDPTAQEEPWTAPHTKVANAAWLAAPETTMKLVDLSSLTVTDLDMAADANRVISHRNARIDASTWGLAYAGTAVNQHGGWLRQRRLLLWTGSTTLPTYVTGAPEGGQDVIAHLNRLFVLGGVDIAGGLTALELNTLYFSDEFGPTTNTAADWTDNVSGLSNKIVVGNNDTDDFGVALAKVGQDLVIFKRRSIHVLYGYSPDTYTVRTFTSALGCIDQRSIVQADNGVFFMSDQGYMYFDGSNIVNVSRPIQTELLRQANYWLGPIGFSGGRAVATYMGNGYIMLTVGFQDIQTGGTWDPDGEAECYLFHTPTGRWAHFSCDATESIKPTFVGRTSNHTYLVDDFNVVKTDYVLNPDFILPAAGPDTGYGGYDVVRRGGVTYTEATPAEWHSPLLRLNTLPHMSQLHRFLVNYAFALDGTAENDSGGGWYVTLVSGTGSTVLSEFQVPTMGDTTSFLFQRRHVVDCFTESSDVQVRIHWEAAGTPPALEKAEIYGAAIEFQKTRQRRST